MPLSNANTIIIGCTEPPQQQRVMRGNEAQVPATCNIPSRYPCLSQWSTLQWDIRTVSAGNLIDAVPPPHFLPSSYLPRLPLPHSGGCCTVSTDDAIHHLADPRLLPEPPAETEGSNNVPSAASIPKYPSYPHLPTSAAGAAYYTVAGSRGLSARSAPPRVVLIAPRSYELTPQMLMLPKQAQLQVDAVAEVEAREARARAPSVEGSDLGIMDEVLKPHVLRHERAVGHFDVLCRFWSCGDKGKAKSKAENLSKMTGRLVGRLLACHLGIEAPD